MQTYRGFTLMELLVVIAIAAILIGLAVPGFRDFILSAQSRDAATSLYSGLARARSEAIARNLPLTFCARTGALDTPTCASANTTNWNNGWIAYFGATPTAPFLLQGPLPDGLNLTGAASPITFEGSGRLTSAAALFNACHTTLPDRHGRRVTISRSGRVVLGQRPC
jgi:type IV fimbrial biogenesis protein FimT